VPVAGQHAPVVGAYQYPQGIAVAAADDLVHRGHRRHHYPQPTAATHRGLIDIGGLLPRRRQQFVHDWLQPFPDLGLGGANLAGAQRMEKRSVSNRAALALLKR
jgi:hypothetical protein